MNSVRKQTHWIALIALMLVFAACKGESPTAPPIGGGGGGGGGVTPPTGASVTVAASSTSLEVDQTTVVSATVTVNGTAAPNGTAVQFVTTRGTFADSGTDTTIRTTTNGVATVSLSSATAGTAVVTATVNNVTRQSPTITFNARPVTQPRPSTDPTITSVTPTFGLPTGGETIRIAGTNFRGRVRVFFDIPGEASPRELFVTGQTETEITAITPNVQLAPGQELSAAIRVIVDADTTNQRTVAAPAPFVFRTVVLTPTVVTASPNSGPITGGTRITLFGNGFQAPVQVLFGAAESRVVGDVRFDSIVVEAPPAHEALGAVGTVGSVDITVINVNSGTRTSLSAGFRYTPTMTITGITPLNGPALGGTDITVNGIGLDGRLQATIGGAEAQILRIAGTSVLLRTNPAANPCSNSGGPITLTNLDTGLTTTSSQSFTLLGVQPRITSVSGPVNPGANVTVTVTNPGIGPLGFGDIKFTVNGVTTIPSPNQVTVGTGAQTFTVAVPTSGIVFPTIACTISGSPGTQLGPTEIPIIFTNLTTGCTDTASVRVTPPGPNPCVVPPIASMVAPANPACPGLVIGNVAAAGTTTISGTIRIANNAVAGASNLTVAAAVASSTNTTTFTVTPPSASAAPGGGTQDFTVTVDPAAAGAFTGTIRLTTNDPARPTIDVCVTGNGT
jgi:large repetitive protein